MVFISSTCLGSNYLTISHITVLHSVRKELVCLGMERIGLHDNPAVIWCMWNVVSGGGGVQLNNIVILS